MEGVKKREGGREKGRGGEERVRRRGREASKYGHTCTHTTNVA